MDRIGTLTIGPFGDEGLVEVDHLTGARHRVIDIGREWNEPMAAAFDRWAAATLARYGWPTHPATPGPTEAELRAKRLLKSCLTPYQKREYRTTGSFLVKAGAGGRYRIYRRSPSHGSFNVTYLDDDAGRRHRTRYCIGPEYRSGIPEEDIMLAQKVLLETDEPRFLATANMY